MLSISESELDGLVGSPDASLYLGFLGISSGVCLTLVITLLTVKITDPLSHATFVSMMWVSLGLSLFLAIRFVIAFLATKRKLKELKAESPSLQ